MYDTSGSLTKTQDYVGEVVYADGLLDYLIHEEGRVAYEDNFYQYEYFVKDHLGNVRQVLRIPEDQLLVATMEMENSADEELAFSQLGVSRQVGPEHNVTEGGNQVAWLNAERGRILGPGRTQEIHVGDSLTLQVHGKYADENVQQVNVGSYVTQAAKGRLVESLSELAGSLKHSGTGNPIALLNLADILASDLQHKKAPEAYMLYALYDADSNRYEVGKQVLTKNAANQHEILEENLYISQDGYLETFVVNETAEDVWFDNFMVMSTTSLVVQENHFDPWGLELTGLGFQAGGLNENRYLFNGKELQDDLGLDLYDYGARYFDPAIARFISIDPASDNYMSWTPYHYVMNNPIIFVDPTGMFTELFGENGKKIGEDENGADGNIAIVKNKGEVKRVKANTKAGTHTESSTLNSTVNLPSGNVRDQMGKAVDRSNTASVAAGDAQGGFHEEGGIFGTDSEGNEKVIDAQPGGVSNPDVDRTASVDVFSGETANYNLSEIEGTFHVHPSGVTANGSSFNQEPSNGVNPQTGQLEGDIPNAAANANPSSATHVKGNGYVLGAKSGKVYIYNGGGKVATFPLKQFRTIGIKKK